MSGRTPRHLLLAAVLVAGMAAACDDKAKPSTGGAPAGKRSEAVAATGTNAPPVTPSHVAPTAKPPGVPRKLCEKAPDPKKVGATKMDHLEATGQPSLGDRIPTGGGRWIWLNFWAAWCGPCKEEIPRLRGFEQKLQALGVPMQLVFLSLDDDERQGRKFLEDQPPAGLKTSFWLPDGKNRTAFLESFKLKEPANLPVQLLFGPGGELKCVIDGAVEDADFPQLQAFFKR